MTPPRSDVEVLREMLLAYRNVPCTWGRSHDHAEIDRAIAAIEVMEGKGEVVATVRWHPEHGFNWKSIGDGECGDTGTGWIDVPLRAALPTPPQPNEEKGNG